jgi:hypothetical protein
VVFLFGVVVVVALGVGLWLFSFCSAVFPGVSVLAYVDAGGDFCVSRLHEFFGRWVFCGVWAGRRGVSGGAGGEAPGLAGEPSTPGADVNHKRSYAIL